MLRARLQAVLRAGTLEPRLRDGWVATRGALPRLRGRLERERKPQLYGFLAELYFAMSAFCRKNTKG